MMYKKITVFFAVIPLVLFASAQTSIGFQVGVSSNYLNTSIANRASTTINSKAGYAFGMPFQYRIGSWFYLQTSPGIIRKDYSMDRTAPLAGIYEQHNNTYLQLPLTANFAYGKRLQVFAGIGAYIGYWLSGRVKGRTPNVFSVSDSINSALGQQVESFQLTAYNQKYVINSQKDRRVEFGCTESAGLSYEVAKGYRVLAGCTFYQSLTDQQKSYMLNQVPQYNETASFSIGGLYSFK